MTTGGQSASDTQFLSQAIELSRKHMQAGDGGPFGALVVREGQVLGTGWNQVTSTNDPTAHAEVVAIRSATSHVANFSLEGATLYTSCEPCPMCLAAAYWARLSRIVFAATRQDAARAGFDDDFLYRELPLPIAERKLRTDQMLASDAAAVFDEWIAKADKVAY